MKFLRNVIIVGVILAGVGYGIYHIAAGVIADKVVDQVEQEIYSSTDEETIKQSIDNNPELQEFLADAPQIDQSQLPFTTKEGAVKNLIKKFSVGEIQEISETVNNGMTQEEQMVLLEKIEGKLSPEELDAMKVVMYKELNK
ncbi:hypothetical protein [Sediminibacillus halophilus]|uniref:Phenylalanyl-tRNA synthetase subunit beta n=1 Tax=Sediminibacillus halophilus TaxID=482461 RepID=A0A1G9X0Z9_9BACI|nr:hypothetical protein [Sediminibacillus halophilus]SDM90191.1 hypothetical protein SAMN05216244_3698 [Sediminibacillus halophilus]